MTPFQRKYYAAFIFAILICWSPFNALAYLAPILIILWMIFVGNSGAVAVRAYTALMLWLSLLAAYKLYQPDFVLENGIIAFLTYSAIITMFAVPTRFLVNRALLARMLNIMLIVALVEGTLGIIQAVYAFQISGSFDFSNGDFVEGTLHPQLAAEQTFSNPMFASLMAITVIFLVSQYSLTRRSGKTAILVGIISFVLASVVHATLFLLLAIIMAYFFYRPGILFGGRLIRGRYAAIAFLVVIVFMIFRFQSANLQKIVPLAADLLAQDFPKTAVMVRFYTEVPDEYPSAPYVGLGPGQYTSRASLIGTGQFFGGPFSGRKSPVPIGSESKPFNVYVRDLWIQALTVKAWGGGTTALPHSSWNSILSEFGLIGFLVVVGFVISYLGKVKRFATTHEEKILAFSFGACTIFIFLLGFQENFWEIPQAILIGLLLLKVMYATVVYGNQGDNQVSHLNAT